MLNRRVFLKSVGLVAVAPAVVLSAIKKPKGLTLEMLQKAKKQPGMKYMTATEINNRVKEKFKPVSAVQKLPLCLILPPALCSFV